MPPPGTRSILDRIQEGSIETNYLLYPPTIGPFERSPLQVGDATKQVYLSEVFYSYGDQIGLVRAEDLWRGLRRVWALDRSHVQLVERIDKPIRILYAEPEDELIAKITGRHQ